MFSNQTDALCISFSPLYLYSPISSVLILKSIPIVEINVGLNVLSANRNIPNSAIAYKKKLEKQVEIGLRHFASLALCYVTVGFLREGEWGVVNK